MPLHVSVPLGDTAASPSSQSPPTAVPPEHPRAAVFGSPYASPSASTSLASTAPLQSSSIPLHASALPGKRFGSASSQSPAQVDTPSWSASCSSTGRTPSQLSSAPSHSSTAPVNTLALASSQS